MAMHPIRYEAVDPPRGPQPYPSMDEPRDLITTIVQPLDTETVLSQPTRTSSAPVTMSWIGQSLGATGGESSDDLPPEYSSARAPTRVLEYTFSPCGPNAMILVPPADAADTRPLFHISHSLNMFNPPNGCTSLRRGGSAETAIVGEFEWGTSSAPPTVTMRGVQYEAREVLKFGRASHIQIWFWNGDRHRRLYWRTNGYEATCYQIPANTGLVWTPVADRDSPIAVFRGRPLRVREDHRPHPPVTLTLYPRAHEGSLLDHVVLAALLLERRRFAVM